MGSENRGVPAAGLGRMPGGREAPEVPGITKLQQRLRPRFKAFSTSPPARGCKNCSVRPLIPPLRAIPAPWTAVPRCWRRTTPREALPDPRNRFRRSSGPRNALRVIVGKVRGSMGVVSAKGRWRVAKSIGPSKREGSEARLVGEHRPQREGESRPFADLGSDFDRNRFFFRTAAHTEKFP